MKSKTLQSLKQRQRDTILFSLPLSIIGLFIVVYALLNAAWPPDYVDAPDQPGVSHIRRLLGDDAPKDLPATIEVKRSDGYQLRRVLDALIYYVVLQGIIAVVGLAWLTERYLYGLLVVSGLYGTIYAATLGNVIGPILTIVGFALVLWGAVLGWLTTRNLRSSLERLQLENAEI